MRVKHRKLIDEVLTEFAGGATTPLEIASARRVLKAHGLPLGDAQVRERLHGGTTIRDRVIGGLVVEFDGRLGHADPHGRFRDFDRDNQVALTGRPTLRFGWTDVHENTCEAADQVVEGLAMMGTSVQPNRCSARCRSQYVE